MWTRSRHSSHGPAMVVLYRASLMLEGLPSPRPVVFGMMRTDEGGEREKARRRKDRYKTVRGCNVETVFKRVCLFRQVWQTGL